MHTSTETSTQRYSNERERNITIKLGYANCKIWGKESEKNINLMENMNIQNFLSTSGKKNVVMDDSQNELDLLEHISFIDCPGHQELILTMMSGISIMDYIIIVVAVDEQISIQKQFMEHLNAALESNIKKCIFILNKIDLVRQDIVLTRYEELKSLILSTKFKNSPIIPTSLNSGYNKEYILYYILNWFNDIEITNRNEDSSEENFFRITRSFNINKSEISWKDIQGGAVGGSVVKGEFNINDNVYIYPGIWKKVTVDDRILFKVIPLKTRIESIRTEETDLTTAKIGGLISLKTEIDPFYVKNDKLAGNLLTNKVIQNNFDVIIELEFLSYQTDFEEYKFDENRDQITITISSHNINSNVVYQKDKIIKVELSEPTIILSDDIIIISKKIEQSLRIIGKCKKIF